MSGPLSGIKVIDVSAVISGPFCCQMLADLGAEVIKVEPRQIGDLTRIGAFRVGNISAMYAAANRGKPSVALDLSSAAGIDVFKRLAADADVRRAELPTRCRRADGDRPRRPARAERPR